MSCMLCFSLWFGLVWFERKRGEGGSSSAVVCEAPFALLSVSYGRMFCIFTERPFEEMMH